MNALKKPLKRLARRVTNPFRAVKLWIKEQTGWLGVPKIIPYRGYGNNREVIAMGTVTEDKGLSLPEHDDSIWENMLAMFKRYISDEIPGVRVLVKFYDQEKIVETDEDGFFVARFKTGDQIKACMWHEVHFILLDEVITDQELVEATGEVFIITGSEEHAIISDVDDTILVSHSTNLLKKMRLMLLKNAATRIPFEGVASFYKALQTGRDQVACNPVFFISSSEWNLYDLLLDFCKFNHIPKGVFLLKQLKNNIFHFWKSGGGSHAHKLKKINGLMQFYHLLNFILIGDSGQKDPDIYLRTIRTFPGRVKAVYIRDIRKKKRKHLLDLTEKFKKLGVELVVVKNTYEASIHAVEKGYLRPEFIQEIKKEYELDINKSPALKKVLEKISSD
jgi:phosphatidate phosphatase APP1